jgi:hypothetical protein
MAFLSARATEFKPGGLLTMSFICRSEPPSVNRGTPRDPPRSYTTARSHDTPKGAPAKNLDSPSSTKPMARERSHSSPASSTPTAGRSRDIWTVLSGILAKAIQRLVSTQLLKPAVARQLLGTSHRLRSTLADLDSVDSSSDPSSYCPADKCGTSCDAASVDRRVGGRPRTRASSLARSQAQYCLPSKLHRAHDPGQYPRLIPIAQY